MNAQQRRVINDDLAEYDRLDNIAFSDLIKACRHYLSETREFNRVYVITEIRLLYSR